jgi:hypothetical protein
MSIIRANWAASFLKPNGLRVGKENQHKVVKRKRDWMLGR